MFKLGKSVIIGAVSAAILAGAAGYFYLENSGWTEQKDEKGVVTSKMKHFEASVLPLKDIHEILRKHLHDVDSAKIIIHDSYKDVGTQYKDDVTNIVCGELNAKNMMGAYAGYKAFMIVQLKAGAPLKGGGIMKDDLNFVDIDNPLVDSRCKSFKELSQGKN